LLFVIPALLFVIPALLFVIPALLFVIPALSRDPVHAAGICKKQWSILDPGSSPGMTKFDGCFNFMGPNQQEPTPWAM
jgi:hypothetical protein